LQSASLPVHSPAGFQTLSRQIGMNRFHVLSALLSPFSTTSSVGPGFPKKSSIDFSYLETQFTTQIKINDAYYHFLF
jgi:hypothetical protein